jgi:thymidylate synthase (FAD)
MQKLIWSTPNGDDLVAYMARVSNPKASVGDPSERLIAYLLRNGHWSPFEMVNAVVEINTTRDISRQILRHRSFSFQEFSGRYAAYDTLAEPREARLQDSHNRQNSLATDDDELKAWWIEQQVAVRDLAGATYQEALERGVAKEVARAVLPEGMTPTRMYMNGTLRSWIHYFQARCEPGVQKEHRDLAIALRGLVFSRFPLIAKAYEDVHQETVGGGS